ncbi:MAG: hypothetical protein RR190_02065 [Bacteroidales bacterium]
MKTILLFLNLVFIFCLDAQTVIEFQSYALENVTKQQMCKADFISPSTADENQIIVRQIIKTN